MIFHLGNILVIITLAVLAWQDFRSRLISWWLIPVLLLGFILIGKEQVSWNDLAKNFLLNLSFLFLQFLLVWLWMSFRNRKFINPIDNQIGLGDLLFFICLAAGFSPVNFFLFYTAALILVLFVVILLRQFHSEKTKLIPLAGAISLPMIFLCFFRLLNPAFDFYSENWLNVLTDLNLN